jgi:hypothetical protein
MPFAKMIKKRKLKVKQGEEEAKQKVDIERINVSQINVRLPKNCKLLDNASEDDPGLTIDWTDNFDLFLAGVNALQPQGWLGLNAFPVTASQLKVAILQFVSDRVRGGGGVIGRNMIAPNTVEEYAGIIAQLYGLQFDPIVVQVGVDNIGRVYIHKDRQRQALGTHQVIATPYLLGMHLFQ